MSIGVCAPQLRNPRHFTAPFAPNDRVK